jgi:tRNA-dihydrouridine synthase
MPYKVPGPGERMAAALRHLERLAADLGERRACVEMRKHFCAYTKAGSMPGGAALRNRLVHGETIADFWRVLEEAGLLPA